MKSFDDSAYRNKPGYVYLIHAKERRRYKIGLTTRSVDQRFNELNGSQSPYPLELLQVLKTDNVTETERHLHDKFSSQRRHGEWFEFSNRQLKEVFREFERLENGNRAWFRFPTLPSISLPNLPSLESIVGGGLQLDANIKGLAIAAIGAAWLSINFAGCIRQSSPPNQKPQTQSSQRL